MTMLADNRLLAEYGELSAGVKLHAEPRRDDAKPAPPPLGEEPTEPALKLRLHPKELTAVIGARKLVTAWTCPADDRSPFGPDREPGTADDACDPVEAEWSLWHPADARLNKTTGHKVLVQMTMLADNRLLGDYGELSAGVKLHAEPRPDDAKAGPAPAG